MRVTRADSAHMLFTTCPLLALQPLLHYPVTSHHLSLPTHAFCFPASFTLPGPQLPTLGKVPEVHSILEGLDQIPSLLEGGQWSPFPPQHAHCMTLCTFVHYLKCKVVGKSVFWWLCPLLTHELSKAGNLHMVAGRKWVFRNNVY